MSLTLERVAEDSEEVVNNDGKKVRTHTIKYLTKTGQERSTFYVIQNCGKLIGEVHSDDSSATLRKIKPTRKETIGQFTAFDLELVYSTDAAAPDNADEDPCNQRVKRSQGTVEQTLYIIKDRSGAIITNKANQPYSGGIPVSLELPTFVYEKNERTYDRTRVSQWCNALNLNTFNGCDPGTLKLKITADENFQGKFHWWSHRYEMAFLPFGWQPSPINAGLMELTTLLAGLIKPILDPHTRQPVTDPWPLDADGHALAVGSLPAGINYIDVDFFNENSYSQLGLQEF